MLAGLLLLGFPLPLSVSPTPTLCEPVPVEGIEEVWAARPRLHRWGRGDALVSVTDACDSPRSEIRHEGITEWYARDERGLEQGFTIREAPARGVGDEPLRLVLTLGERFSAEILPGGCDARLFPEEGGSALSYSGLRAWDANGAALSAQLAPAPGGLAIHVDDRDAAYPITVDPMIWIERDRITPTLSPVATGWSQSMSRADDWLVVGAFGDDTVAPGAGAAYVFQRFGPTWWQRAVLTAPDAEALDHFGISVSLSGDTALIGVPNDDDRGGNAGAAYVYVRSGFSWVVQAKLTASDASASDVFGRTVCLSGDLAFVGAPYADGGGAVYVFQRIGTGWFEQAKLIATGTASSDNFGDAIAFQSGTALIGAPGAGTGGSYTGTTFVFVRTGSVWSRQAILTAGDPTAAAGFGNAVAFDGETAVIGSPWDDSPSYSSGSAYVFFRAGSQWGQQAKLTAADASSLDLFGRAVALEGDLALVGAPQDVWGGGQTGAAYSFARTGSTWSQESLFRPTAPVFGGNFGQSLQQDGNRVLVGSTWDPADLGGVYEFERLSGPDATCQWYCGNGYNVDTYQVVNPFVIGGTFVGSVGIWGPNYGAVLAAFLGQATFPLWGREALVDVTTPEVMGLPSTIGVSPVTVSWMVPNEYAYAGYQVFTQAAGFGGGMIRLTCAYDCTVGY